MLTDGDKTCSCGRGCTSFGACLRAKRITTTVGLDTSSANVAMRRLDAYEDATRQGIQPRTTGQRDIDAAVQISEATGAAFDGGLI